MGLSQTMESAADCSFDICVDVTGLSPVIYSSIQHTKKGGQVLLLGSPRQSYKGDLTSVFSLIHMKDLKLIGGFNQTIPVYENDGSDNCLLRNFKICEKLILSKAIDISLLISKMMDPADCQKAYELLMYHKDEVNGIVFDWRNY